MREGAMGDETCCIPVHPTKKQSMVWKCVEEPAPKKFKVVKSARKVMLTVF